MDIGRSGRELRSRRGCGFMRTVLPSCWRRHRGSRWGGEPWAMGSACGGGFAGDRGRLDALTKQQNSGNGMPSLASRSGENVDRIRVALHLDRVAAWIGEDHLAPLARVPGFCVSGALRNATPAERKRSSSWMNSGVVKIAPKWLPSRPNCAAGRTRSATSGR